MTTTATRRLGGQKKKKNDEKKNKGLFVEALTVAPAPSRDYYALHLYQKQFLWTRWKISHGPCANPIQKTVSLDQFSKDMTLQKELTYIFGEDTTALMKDLACEKWSLNSMPSNVIQKILSYLTVSDILRISQVCKRLSKECSKDELWKSICKMQWKILIHSDIEKASLISWKKVYLEKMRPKKYKTKPKPKPDLLQRNRSNNVSNLSTPNSTPSLARLNLSVHKRIHEIKSDALSTTSEISGRDFKAISSCTGKLTERVLKTRCTSRNSEFRPFSCGKLNPTPRSNVEGKYCRKSSRSVANIFPLVENPKEDETAHLRRSTRTMKCRVLNVRSASFQDEKPKTEKARPRAEKLVKAE